MCRPGKAAVYRAGPPHPHMWRVKQPYKYLCRDTIKSLSEALSGSILQLEWDAQSRCKRTGLQLFWFMLFAVVSARFFTA